MYMGDVWLEGFPKNERKGGEGQTCSLVWGGLLAILILGPDGAVWECSDCVMFNRVCHLRLSDLCLVLSLG